MTDMITETSRDLAAPPSVPRYTTEHLASLTVGEAWRACDEDKAAMYAVVALVAKRVADEEGFRMPASEGEQAAFLKTAEGQLHGNTGETFDHVIAKVFRMLRNPEPLPADKIAAFNAVRSCKDTRSLCHAPATSMYFGRDGNVSACCYSRWNAFGRYPDNSVSEIWFGQKIADMRSELQRNTLPAGCEKCADQLNAGNYKGLLASNFDRFVEAPSAGTALSKLTALFQKKKPPAYPIRMEFELSNKCNLECAMCSGAFSSLIRQNREKKAPLPDQYDAAFVEQLKEFIPHLKEAKFLGGEPFLIDIYYDIWEIFIETNPTCEISITTNGTAFSPKIKRILDRLNAHIIVSLDSLDKAAYEGIRKNATMERTLANVENFIEVCRQRGRPVSLAVCPMTSNWQGVPDLLAFANSRQSVIYFNTVHYPENLSLKYASADEQRQMLKVLSHRVRDPENDIERGNFAALQGLIQQIEAWLQERAPALAFA